MACIDKILNLGINNLRKIGNGVIAGATLEGQPQLLSRVKDAGIRTIVDFRSEATPQIEEECRVLGLRYFKLGLNHTISEGQEMKISRSFASRLKEFFNIMNEGDAYIGCKYGIDRTNSGLLLNYFFNPQSLKFRIPQILPGTFDKCSEISPNIKKRMPKVLINTINKTIRKIQQSVKRMTPAQRAELGIPEGRKERFEKCFRDKIGELIRFNSTTGPFD